MSPFIAEVDQVKKKYHHHHHHLVHWGDFSDQVPAITIQLIENLVTIEQLQFAIVS